MWQSVSSARPHRQKTVIASRTECISCSPPAIGDAISTGSRFVCRFVLPQTRGIRVWFFALGVCVQLEEQETSIPASACIVTTCTPVLRADYLSVDARVMVDTDPSVSVCMTQLHYSFGACSRNCQGSGPCAEIDPAKHACWRLETRRCHHRRRDAADEAQGVCKKSSAHDDEQHRDRARHLQ